MMDGNNELIREGFICPECREDLTSFTLLQAHFELKHSQILNEDKSSSTPNNSSLSSVLTKAKNYFTSSNANNNNDLSPIQASNQQEQQQSNESFTSQVYNIPQEDGVFRSFTKEFKEHRDKTIGRYVIQTNKLLIILDKLVSMENVKDENKRKALEMSLVQWIPDGDVNLCPTCARTFGIMHRKHHCRLCGAIMCNKCSQFLTYTAAKQLTDPSIFMKSDSELKFKRSNSNTSIESSGNSNDNQKEVYIRLCIDCSRLLNKKHQTMKDKSIKPKIFSLYDDFHVCVKESEKLHPIYSKMAQSLSTGETVFNLKIAEDMRKKLILLFQKIDLLSNTILNFGTQKTQSNDNSQQPVIISSVSRDQLKLQKNIRIYAINYLKEFSFTLSILPTKEEYEKLAEQKRQLLIEEIQRESLEKLKLYEIDAKKQQLKGGNYSTSGGGTFINNSDGWVPTINNNFENQDNDNDPIKLQIQVVENYLLEARKQGRNEEIEIFEKNLKELKSIISNR